MPKQPIFTEERRNRILELLKEKNKVLVPELCKTFAVSRSTIRTDLNALYQQGLLQRTHGGAIANAGASYERTYHQKERLHYDAKVQIAQAAAELVNDGDTVIIDTGTTTACMIPFLAQKTKLTVITADIRIALALERYPEITVIIAGGLLRSGFSCTMGAMTTRMISSFNVDKAFMATNGLSESGTLSTPYIEQAEVKKALIEAAKKRVLLCDSSKIGQTSLVDFADLRDFRYFITDRNADKALLEKFGKSFKIEVSAV